MNAESLIERFVDDRESLTDDEVGLLVAALADDAELARQLHEHLVVDDHLSQRNAVDRGGFRAQVDQRIHDYLEGEHELDRRANELRTLAKSQIQNWRQAQFTRLKWFAAMSAMVALLAASVGGYRLYNVWQTVAFVEHASEGAMIERGSNEFPAVAGERILVGDRIATPSQGSLELQFEDGTRVSLLGASSLVGGRHSLPTGGQAKLLMLERGDLFASVEPQEHPMRLKTPVAEALVLGTELQLSARTGLTRLEVIEGKVDLRRNSDGKTVSVASNQAGVASKNALAVTPILWPSNREGLVFQFQTANKPVTATTTDGIQAIQIRPFGNARWNHDFAMQFAGEPTLAASGGFNLPGKLGADIVGQLSADAAVSIEAVITPDREINNGVILRIGDAGDGFAISQMGREFLLNWGEQSASLGAATVGESRHLGIVIDDTQIAVFVNGNLLAEISHESPPTSLLRGATLAFGSKGGDGHWKGLLEGVALYDRAMVESEIKTNARQYLRAIESRAAVPQCEVIVQRIAGSHEPTLAEAAPHPAALQVNGYHVKEIIRGNLHGNAKRLFAADWFLLDRQRQGLADMQAGSVHRFVVERIEDNPQLAPYFVSDDFQKPADRDETRYLVVDHIVETEE